MRYRSRFHFVRLPVGDTLVVLLGIFLSFVVCATFPTFLEKTPLLFGVLIFAISGLLWFLRYLLRKTLAGAKSRAVENREQEDRYGY